MEEIEAGFFTLRKLKDDTECVIYTPRKSNLFLLHDFNKNLNDDKNLDIKWRLFKYPRSIMIHQRRKEEKEKRRARQSELDKTIEKSVDEIEYQAKHIKNNTIDKNKFIDKYQFLTKCN